MLLEYKIKIFHCYLHGPAIRNIIKHVNTHTADTSALVLTGDRDKSAAVGASTKLFKSRRRKKKTNCCCFHVHTSDETDTKILSRSHKNCYFYVVHEVALLIIRLPLAKITITDIWCVQMYVHHVWLLHAIKIISPVNYVWHSCFVLKSTIYRRRAHLVKLFAQTHFSQKSIKRWKWIKERKKKKKLVHVCCVWLRNPKIPKWHRQPSIKCTMKIPCVLFF